MNTIMNSGTQWWSQAKRSDPSIATCHTTSGGHLHWLNCNLFVYQGDIITPVPMVVHSFFQQVLIEHITTILGGRIQ
jgi:hypothetical protein